MFKNKVKKSYLTITLKNIICLATLFYTIILLVVITASYICIKKTNEKLYCWIELDNIERQVLEARRYEKTYLLYHNRENLLYALDYVDKIESEIKKDKTFIKKLKIKKDFVRFKQLLNEYKNILETLVNRQMIDKETANNLRKKGHEITVLFSKIRERVIANLDKEIKIYSSIPLFVFGITIIFVPIVAFILAKWIIEPIEYLASNAKKISEGKLKNIPKYKGFIFKYKEYDQLIETINEMLKALNSKQEELLRTTKLAAIGTAVSSIAHEINNPLNNIYLTAEVIFDNIDELDKEELLDMLKDIYHEAERAREIVIHLLEFARTKKDIHIEPVNLDKLIKDSYRIISNQLRTKNIEGHLEIPQESIKISGNFNQLQQVLIDIMVNAIQAMEDGGILSIKGYKEDNFAVIEISDTGPGIPEEIRDKIFEPFFTTKEEGTGLGLSVAYNIIKKHRGDIKVESKPGKGTTFKIIIPLWRESQE